MRIWLAARRKWGVASAAQLMTEDGKVSLQTPSELRSALTPAGNGATGVHSLPVTRREVTLAARTAVREVWSMSAPVSEPSFTLAPVTASFLIFTFVTEFFFSWLTPTAFLP